MAANESEIGVFILAKNEAANLSRCLDALADSDWGVHVLDSGSTDGTQQIASRYERAQTHDYSYVDHCAAYNDITTTLAHQYRVALILDADMVVSDQLRHEVNASLNGAGALWDALQAPVEMWIDGVPLSSGSLYPPKLFAFVTGRPLFVRSGHAELLLAEARVRLMAHPLRHDDRKPYAMYLQSQARYAANLIARYRQGNVSRRDRWRVSTPLFIAAVPIFSLVVKRGFLAGRAGLLYALDRLIAEAVMYRTAVAARMKSKTNGQ